MNRCFLLFVDPMMKSRHGRLRSLTVWARPIFAALAIAGLLLCSPIGAGAQTSSLDFDDTQKLEQYGKVIERVQELAKEYRSAGAREREQIISTVKKIVMDIYNNATGDYSTIELQTTDPNASGGGTNISRDGACVVGYLDNGFQTPNHALRWIVGGNSLDLGTLDPANNASRTSFATDANQDCSVIVGISDIAGGTVQHAFRWTPGGMVDLGVPANGGPNSRALAVSSNGTVIVGDADFPAGAFTRKGAFRWVGGSFTDLIPGITPSLATAVSADGTAVVGQVGTSTASSAFRWTTQNPTMQPIGPLPGHTTAAAIGVSDNGKVIVGISQPTFLQYQGVVLGWNPGIVFRWAESGTNAGIKDMRDILIANGVNMTGITLVSVTGISPDGQWIQGRATTPQTGQNETVAFIAQICDEAIGGLCSTAGTVPFTLGTASSQLSVAAGQSASTTITVTPSAGFAQPVSFSCGGLPVGAACSFNPATVTPAGGPVNTTLTISTTGGSVALMPGATTVLASLLTPIFLIPLGMLMRRHGSDRRLFSIASGCLITLAMVGMLSCSSSDSSSPPANNSGGSPPANGTPAGTSNVTVTAISGSNSRGVPLTFTVTR